MNTSTEIFILHRRGLNVVIISGYRNLAEKTIFAKIEEYVDNFINTHLAKKECVVVVVVILHVAFKVFWSG